LTDYTNKRPPDGPPQVVHKSLKYREQQEYLLRRLGSALVLQWDALPDALQDLVIDQAAIVEDKSEGAHAPRDIEDFIRGAKTVALTKAPRADSKEISA
jgi:hypothetical protein